MLADAAGPSEKADEADLLNSESEYSEEEELNPDDFSEDVSHNICCNVFFISMVPYKLISFIQPIYNFGPGALPELSICDARISPIILGCPYYLAPT